MAHLELRGVVILAEPGRSVAVFFFFQAEDGIRDADVTGVQTCALPILTAACSLDRAHGEARRDRGQDGRGRREAAGWEKTRRDQGRGPRPRGGPAHPLREFPGRGEDRVRGQDAAPRSRQAHQGLRLRLQAPLHHGQDQAGSRARVRSLMRMSRERLFGLADRIVSDLATTEGVVIRQIADEKVRSQLRTEVFRVLEEEGRLEETIDQEVRKTLGSYSRPVPEGSAEWEILYNKTRDEVYKRRLRL